MCIIQTPFNRVLSRCHNEEILNFLDSEAVTCLSGMVITRCYQGYHHIPIKLLLFLFCECKGRTYPVTRHNSSVAFTLSCPSIQWLEMLGTSEVLKWSFVQCQKHWEGIRQWMQESKKDDRLFQVIPNSLLITEDTMFPWLHCTLE